MNLKQAWRDAINQKWINGAEDTQYALVVKDKTVILAIEGSVSTLDWIQNFMFWKKPYKEMKHLFFVHAGWLKKWKAIRKEVIPEIVKYYNQGYKIKVRGYSQGAGIGYLAHEDIHFHTGEQPDTVLFGTPRTFSCFNSKILNKRLSTINRIEDGNDIVCHLPFAVMFYKHYGMAIHIGDKKYWWKLSIKDHENYRRDVK